GAPSASPKASPKRQPAVLLFDAIRKCRDPRATVYDRTYTPYYIYKCLSYRRHTISRFCGWLDSPMLLANLAGSSGILNFHEFRYYMNQSISNPHIHSRILREVNRLQRGAPFVIGVNGIDGSGKTVFSNGLAQFLEEQGTETIVILEGIFIFRK